MATRAYRPGSTVSGAKLGVYGGIATALITTVGGIIVAVMNHPNVVPLSNDTTVSAPVPASATASKESTWTTITPNPVSKGSDQGPVDKYAINDSRTEVKVWGHADKGVDAVFLLIGPKPSAGGYWLAFTTIFNQQWEADVTTAPQISPDFKIWAIPHTPDGGAPSGKPVTFTFQNDPPMPPKPPPSPDPLMNCAAQHGPDCFTGPDWGPPSVYQPNQ